VQSQVVALLLATFVSAAPTRASLDIDASALGDAGPAVEGRLTTRGERVLRDGDVLPGQGPQDALITIRVDTLPDAIGYRYAFTVTRGGELVPGGRGEAECRTCSEAELAEQLDGAIARLIPRLQPEEDEDTTPAEPPPPAVVAPAPVTPVEPRWTVGSMGGTGIVLTGVGGLTLGLGVGLAVAEPVLLDGNAERNSTVRVAGLAVAVSGVALAATGVTLMLIERSRSRRRTSAHLQGATLRF
jgi:hypothetical protein